MGAAAIDASFRGGIESRAAVFAAGASRTRRVFPRRTSVTVDIDPTKEEFK
jgi:hypothetical protein